jgi:calcineurin-like phosphoesterase family protein
MSKFYTADPHVGHKNIIKYASRPFQSVKEMNETLIKNWNSVVKTDDETFVVGDYAFCCDITMALDVFYQLNGRKHLIIGNHDQLALEMERMKPGTWASISDMREVIDHNQKIVLCHYALRTWLHSYKSVWHLFGHTHGTLPPYGKSFDIGVDCWNYTPVSFAQIKAKMDTLPNIHAIPKEDEWDKSDRK